MNGNGFDEEKYSIHKDEKLVLFLGRITMQKGPEYFLAAAKKVLEVIDNVKFVMAGSGDLMHHSIELAAQLGIGHKVLFKKIISDDKVQIQEAVKNVLDSGIIDVALFCGGTGIAPSDVTIETVSPFWRRFCLGSGRFFGE
jgi:molybdopterin biosynthesis enzyme MoaB